MTKHLLSTLQESLFGSPRRTKKRNRSGDHRRKLAMESLETRQLLSITTLDNLSASENTGEKPQSKVFEYAGQWWNVMPTSSGTFVHRLDGTSWTPTQQITSEKGFHADVKVVDDLAHVLLFDKSDSQLATLQYDAADNRFEPWQLQPNLVSVPISGSAETATIEVDSTGRLWVAYDVKSTVEVRYADGLYTSFSSPITVVSGMNSDDISAIIAMPNDTIGVLWSNQSNDRFGFRVHVDGASPTEWSADEVPASQSALGVGGGMADDHLNLAVSSDGTVYAAVKTSYDKSSYPKIALLVRRPDGTWDNLYSVDSSGTRPIVVVNELANKLIVAYTSSEGGGSIYYRESPLDNISFGPRQTLITSSVNNVTSTKHTSTNEIVFLASEKGVLFRFDTVNPTVNQAPNVSAGPDRAIAHNGTANLDGLVNDDGLPAPAILTTSWTLVSGPGNVTFTDSSAVDTTATFNQFGTYVLRLTADDGEYTASDEMTVSVSAPPPPANEAPIVSAGPNRSIALNSSAPLDGAVNDDGLPSPANVTVAWTQVSGPGSATFADESAVDTTATFTEVGVYVLRLTASDGELSHFDDVSVTVSEAAEIIKTLVDGSGAVYTLDTDGWLSYNGARVWQTTYDFAFSPVDGTLFWQSTYGLFQHRLPDGKWQNLDHDVFKFAIAADGTAYTLGADGWLAVNGSPIWQNTKDFQLAADQTLYWLATNGLLQRRMTNGTWQDLDYAAASFRVREDGLLYSLEPNNLMKINGSGVWAGTRDFIFTEDQKLYWLSTSGLLQRQRADNSWEDLDVNVATFAISHDGSIYTLTNDGSLNVDGVPTWSDILDIRTDESGSLILESLNGSIERLAGRFVISQG